MGTEFWLAVMIRTLPAVVVFGLAFIVAADKKSRERWADWMYQLGNIRSDQREDPQVQRGVRLPFFVAAVLLLIIPIRFYWYLSPTRSLGIVAPAHTSPPKTVETVASPVPTDGTMPPPAPTPTTPPVSNGPIGLG